MKKIITGFFALTLATSLTAFAGPAKKKPIEYLCALITWHGDIPSKPVVKGQIKLAGPRNFKLDQRAIAACEKIIGIKDQSGTDELSYEVRAVEDWELDNIER